MNGRQVMLVSLIHLAIALAVITAATVLCALHDLDAEAVTALYGAAIGLVGGSGAGLVSAARNGISTAAPPAGVNA